MNCQKNINYKSLFLLLVLFQFVGTDALATSLNGKELLASVEGSTEPVIFTPIFVDSLMIFVPVESSELAKDPKADGLLGAFGIDSDGDGVRDDIERYIAYTFLFEPQTRSILYRFARELDFFLKFNGAPYGALRSMYGAPAAEVITDRLSLDRSILKRCIVTIRAEQFDGKRIIEDLMGRYYNTDVRKNNAIEETIYISDNPCPDNWRFFDYVPEPEVEEQIAEAEEMESIRLFSKPLSELTVSTVSLFPSTNDPIGWVGLCETAGPPAPDDSTHDWPYYYECERVSGGGLRSTGNYNSGGSNYDDYPGITTTNLTLPPTLGESVPGEGVIGPEPFDCLSQRAKEGVWLACNYLTQELWINAGRPRLYSYTAAAAAAVGADTSDSDGSQGPVQPTVEESAPTDFGNNPPEGGYGNTEVPAGGYLPANAGQRSKASVNSGIQWTPVWTFSGSLDYFEGFDYSLTDGNGAPGRKVRRYVPWSPNIAKPDCNNWQTVYLQFQCSLGGLADRKDLLSFGSSQYTADASDPTDHFGDQTMLEFLYMAGSLSEDSDFLRIETETTSQRRPVRIKGMGRSKPSAGTGGPDWPKYRAIHVVLPNINVITQVNGPSDIPYQAGASIMTPGSMVSLEVFLARAQKISDRTGRPVYTVYMAQNLCYLLMVTTDCNPWEYEQQLAEIDLRKILAGVQTANLNSTNPPTSFAIGSSYTASIMLKESQYFDTLTTVLTAPAMPPMYTASHYDNLRTTVSPVINLYGTRDLICWAANGCAGYQTLKYESTRYEYGNRYLIDIQNDVSLMVDPFSVEGLGHDISGVQDAFPFEWY